MTSEVQKARRRERAAKWARENPERILACQRERREKNRAKLNAYSNRWLAQRRRDPEHGDWMRFQRVLRHHGLTLDQYHSKLESQDFVCPLCETDLSTRRGRTIHVDHDHATGKFRGILCAACNTGIGKLKELRGVLLAALQYLGLSEAA